MLLAELQERHQIRVAFEVQLILCDRRRSEGERVDRRVVDDDDDDDDDGDGVKR